ncbi:Sulfur transfer protein involved in thiamine biosynthesis [Gloeomargarita lithophora Alchichica-D10]|uniref:Sulfur transfer protein involved in thiamine biosynthesis n=1 Tax=Gloeomargarita lithophora Alchichica-D10 TaxID=1188229 RepID=A0A1J0AH49_9CYAN|nr:sulfur carrier protein ThiS [Gloeomargarita lithophora]APB35219.1 Sulfur transfer protein involved in thiamine biosynthesis [Gloeomargarita lithophora Alchichica-D10]
MTPATAFWLNGTAHACRPGLSVAVLLGELGWQEKPVVIEYNGEVLHRPWWVSTPIQAGDKIEVVTIVGGG